MGPNRKVIYNLFSQTDNDLHAREKRPISKHYSMNGILPLEPHIDSTITKFCDELEKRFVNPPNAGKVCNLGDWILYCEYSLRRSYSLFAHSLVDTWDVVGEVTFSQPIGYLENGYDFDRTLYASERTVDYFCVVGQIPILDYWFDKNPVYRIGPPGFGPIVAISAGHMVERMQGKAAPGYDPAKPDFLDKFIESKKAHPDIVDDAQIISYLMINMFAGADTTAITIRSIFYYSLRNPEVWHRLQKEVGVGDDVVPFKNARAMPYLEACVREAMRIHSAVGMILERYVPTSGLTLPNGDSIPPGAVVGSTYSPRRRAISAQS